MPVSGAIVEIEEGTEEAVLSGLARIPEVSVYGMKENRIVIVIDGGSLGVIEKSTNRIQSMEGVTGVFPVYSTIDE
ncbi:MAG TPA: chaperone NapD [Dissulfurispiraceae bacterium]|nr:chaperone NapD [Dissulfurispiraceae bacterium]